MKMQPVPTMCLSTVVLFRMRYVAAYLLAALGGNENPNVGDLKNILDSVGVGYDAARAAIVVTQCKGKSIPDVSSKL